MTLTASQQNRKPSEREPCGSESRPATVGRQPEASLAWLLGSGRCEA